MYLTKKPLTIVEGNLEWLKIIFIFSEAKHRGMRLIIIITHIRAHKNHKH